MSKNYPGKRLTRIFFDVQIHNCLKYQLIKIKYIFVCYIY